MSIPELLETLDREQDQQQLNVDLSFIGAGGALTDIRQRAQTGTGDDPAEDARNQARRAWFDAKEQSTGDTQQKQPENAPVAKAQNAEAETSLSPQARRSGARAELEA